MFYIGEYVAIVTMSALLATLFWGGWWGPVLPGPVWFVWKTLAFVVVIIWLRATLPRVRHDQLMALGREVLITLGLLNRGVTAVLVLWRGRRNGLYLADLLQSAVLHKI